MKKIIIMVIIIVIIVVLLGFKVFSNKDKLIERDSHMKLNIIINGKKLRTTLYDNSSVDGLIKKLKEGPIIIEMDDYNNMEKVGDLGFSLPQNNSRIDTNPGDLILYQGNSLAIYYDHNSWELTRMGKLDNITKEELVELLGPSDVRVKLELEKD